MDEQELSRRVRHAITNMDMDAEVREMMLQRHDARTSRRAESKRTGRSVNEAMEDEDYEEHVEKEDLEHETMEDVQLLEAVAEGSEEIEDPLNLALQEMEISGHEEPRMKESPVLKEASRMAFHKLLRRMDDKYGFAGWSQYLEQGPKKKEQVRDFMGKMRWRVSVSMVCTIHTRTGLTSTHMMESVRVHPDQMQAIMMTKKSACNLAIKRCIMDLL